MNTVDVWREIPDNDFGLVATYKNMHTVPVAGEYLRYNTYAYKVEMVVRDFEEDPNGNFFVVYVSATDDDI